MHILTFRSRATCVCCLYLLFIPFFLLEMEAFCQNSTGKVMFPGIKHKNGGDLPFFSVYYVPALRIGVSNSGTPRIILAVWEDGYCVYSEDKVKGGPPYKQANIPAKDISNLSGALSVCASLKVTDYIVPDSSFTVIAFYDKTTSQCISLRSSHEHFPKQAYSQQYDIFFHTWQKIRTLAQNIKCEDTSDLNDVEFALFHCIPENANACVLFRHIGSERKTIPPVILFSSDERHKSAISDIPEYLREFVREEPTEASVISELYECLVGKPSSSSTGFGTTLVAFYWPKHKVEYTLNLDQMREFKAKWQTFSPLPSAVADYFTRIGLTNEEATSDSSLTWHTDKPPIEKRVPLLTPFDGCIWYGGQASNNTGRGLPAPEDYFVKGFIKITEQSASTLQEKYQWTPLTLDVATIDWPTTASIADGFFKGNRYLESKDFMREHTKRSSFSSGRIILNPDAMIVYFDLQNL